MIMRHIARYEEVVGGTGEEGEAPCDSNSHKAENKGRRAKVSSVLQGVLCP